MKLIGASVARVEDARFLTGRGRYIDDVTLRGMLHAAFVRSPFAHARVLGVDTHAAGAAEGVVAVFTGADLAACTRPMAPSLPLPGLVNPSYEPMVTDRARFVGDHVAMVVARSRYLAEDAAELVEVDYEPLPAITTAGHARDPGLPPLFEEAGTNLLLATESTFGDVDAAFAAADRVVRATLHQSRQSNQPMETRGAIVDHDRGTGLLTFHAATQTVHGLRFHLAEILDHPLDLVRVLCPDVGGAFGVKGTVPREYVALAAAGRLLGRPVKWIEDRNEHLLASGQAREEEMELEAAVADDGRVLGLRARHVIDQGSYPAMPYPAALFSGMICSLLPGPYRIGALAYEGTVVATNKCWVVPYRGPWEMETWARERMLDLVAQELGLDAAEVRRRNLVDGGPDEVSVTGMPLAGVTSRECFERALDLVGYEELRREQAEARRSGRVVGVGMATYVEAAPGPAPRRDFDGEEAIVRIEPNGHVVVVTSQSPHGQGHETTLAQLAADTVGVPLEQVRVVHGDSFVTPFNMIGTGGSRAATWASGAVIASARRVRERVLDLAAAVMEIAPSDLEIVDGSVVPKGVPGKAVPIATLAQQAHLSPRSVPAGTDHRLEAREMFTGAGVSGSGWSGGTHVCVTEIDPATGLVTILRYLVVEDCGQVINPAVVEGQICGGVAQGIAGVLYERAVYDDDGQLLTGSFLDYLLPTACEIPRIEVSHHESEPGDGIEFRGIGEGGAIVAPAAVNNAIADALAPFGVRVTEQHLPPARLLELLGAV